MSTRDLKRKPRTESDSGPLADLDRSFLTRGVKHDGTSSVRTLTNLVSQKEHHMALENCAHKGCKCKVDTSKAVSQGGKNYCSNHCAQATQSGSGKCNCGHPDCK